LLNSSKCWVVSHEERGGDYTHPVKVFLVELDANVFCDEHNKKQPGRRYHNRTWMTAEEVELVG